MKPISFEVFAYGTWLLTAVLIATVFKNRRDFWYALIGTSFLIPFEWIADQHWMLLDYDPGFAMFPDWLFYKLPLMMCAGWGFFFGSTLIICMLLEKKIDAIKPLLLRILVLSVVFFFWDLFEENAAAQHGLWVYHWPKEVLLGHMPWFIPPVVASGNVMMYFAHKMAIKKSEGASWLKGLAIHTAHYYVVLIIVTVWGIAFIRSLTLFGIRPLPGYGWSPVM